jgi:predicted anti-sigma-YlaC factor YlaD
MKCSTIQRKLSAYMDAEVSEQERTIISEHLASCPECQRILQVLTKMREELNLVPGIQSPPYFYTRLKQRMIDESRSISVLEKIRRFVLPGFATVLTLASLLLGNFMARAIYNGITETGVSTETTNVLGIDAFDQFPEGSVSNLYCELLSGGEE